MCRVIIVLVTKFQIVGMGPPDYDEARGLMGRDEVTDHLEMGGNVGEGGGLKKKQLPRLI